MAVVWGVVVASRLPDAAGVGGAVQQFSVLLVMLVEIGVLVLDHHTRSP